MAMLLLIARMSWRTTWSLCALAGVSASAQAAVIQILHTNDLHAALNTSGEPKNGEPEFGGWAQIKTVMDRLEREAAAKEEKIETIRLDAGDFLEGTMLYFPKNGANVLEAYNQMKWDASTLGNHDWLMGARGLDELVGRLPFAHPLVSANVKVHSRLKNLSRQLKPYTIIERAGMKIGVFGLSTTEAFYKWITRIRSKRSDMKLRDYYDVPGRDPNTGEEMSYAGIANKTIRELRSKADAVIALTHIGFAEDLAVVQESRGLDLVVGGHSHTFLETLNLEKDLDGREIPVVQSGYNGRSVGRILMEILPGKKPRVLTYELVPVPHDTAPDPVVIETTAKANRDLVELYGPEHLHEVIGKADVRLVPGKFGPTAFSKFAVDSIRDAIQADVGIDVGAFHANTPLPGGDVTRLKLMEAYPRKFEADQNQGLSVYQARIPGLVLAVALKFAVKYGVYFSFSGVDYQVQKLSEHEHLLAVQRAKSSKGGRLTPYRAKKIRINGKSICLNCVYKIAAPESLIRGAYQMSFLTRLIIWGGKRTPVTLWEAMERRLRKIGRIVPLEGDELFSPRRFANSYQRQFGDRIDPEETQIEDDTDPQELLDLFLKEYFRIRKANPKIDAATDADSLKGEF